MTAPDQEREALALVKHFIVAGSVHAAEFRTIEALLAQPRLPEEPDEGLIRAVNALLIKQGYRWLADNDHYARTIHGALHAHLTRKPTKKVWDVTYEGEPCAGRHYEAAAALFAAEGLIKRGKVVTITPREVEIPA